jgi:hypothetical protein
LLLGVGARQPKTSSAPNATFAVAAMTKPSLRDTLIFIVIFFTMVAAMFALVLFGMR